MDWFEQLLQGYNPDLGFQGLNEAGSGLTGGMGATTPGIDWSNIDKMINDLGTNAWEGENLGTANSIASLGLPSIPPGIQQLVKSLLNTGNTAGASSLLKSFGIDPNSVIGSGLSLAAREAPGLMALDYAKSQGNDLQAILDQLKGNQGAVVKAATDPLQSNIAAGYGDLLQSLGLRGVRGSSFGNTDIANYIARTGGALANAGANAAQGSLALQGDLTAKAQTLKNNLYGKAFDILGRGLNPGGFGGQLTLATS